jgi:hypothetical protein
MLSAVIMSHFAALVRAEKDAISAAAGETAKNVFGGSFRAKAGTEGENAVISGIAAVGDQNLSNSFKKAFNEKDPDTEIVDINYGINSMVRYEHLIKMAQYEDDFNKNQIRINALNPDED